MTAGRTVGVAAIAAAAVLSLGGAGSPREWRTGAKAGGTYRVAYESSFNFTDGFDPTGEYLTWSFALYSSLLVRTLVGYDHVAGPAGNRLVPDIATSVPKP